MSPTVKSGVSIRPAAVTDIQSVAEIERASFGDPWSEAAFRALYGMRGAIFLVAGRSETYSIAGYVIARVVADQSEILNLAVAPLERRRGLGGELLDAGLAAVRTAGAQEVFLEVRESNSGAFALYTSRGFAALSRRRKYYRNPVEDALLLRRTIE